MEAKCETCRYCVHDDGSWAGEHFVCDNDKSPQFGFLIGDTDFCGEHTPRAAAGETP